MQAVRGIEDRVIVRAVVEDPAPRKMRIERADLERLDYTQGCPGCYNARQRRGHRQHTALRRDQAYAEMLKIPDLRNKLESAQ